MTLYPTFLETPLVAPTRPSVSFDELGEVSLATGDNALPKGSTIALSTSTAPLTTSGGVNLEIPFVFHEFLHEEPSRMDLSGGRVSIPFFSFTVCSARGDVPSPVFPNSSHFVDPPLGLTNQVGDNTFVAPLSLLCPCLSSLLVNSTGEMGGFMSWFHVFHWESL